MTCRTCHTLAPRFVFLNAFHDGSREDEHQRRVAPPHDPRTGRSAWPPLRPIPDRGSGGVADLAEIDMNNLHTIPCDYAELVALAQRFAQARPISSLEIACHGTSTPARWGQLRRQLPGESNEDYAHYVVREAAHNTDAPGYQGRLYYPRRRNQDAQLPITEVAGGTTLSARELDSPGAAIVGSDVELVSGRTIQTDRRHTVLTRALGQCVVAGGEIIWQTCNLAIGLPPHRSFLAAFSQLAPHIRVYASVGETPVGTPGIRGPLVTPGRPPPEGEWDGHREGRQGTVSQTRYQTYRANEPTTHRPPRSR